MIRRATALTAAVLFGLALTAGTSLASPGPSPGHHFPTTLALPDGWQPEGIAIGPGPYGYFGSRATGSLFRIDLATGRGSLLSTGPGTPSLGLKIDRAGRLFVAGGTGGDGRVVDSHTGRVLASYRFTTAPSFVNDVILTPDAAWFTDSTNPVLYKVPLRHGRLPAQAVTVPLSGDIVYGAGINANGIARTPDGRGLLIVQSSTGLLFRVDPRTGATRRVDLGGEALTNGDGLLVIGRTLYAVQNQLNRVAVFRLDRAGTSGRLVERLTDPGFDVPTTVAALGDRLYLPNARFSTPPTPTTTYTVVAIRK
jgi:sugar lactone lactonase YvrE